MKRLLSLLTALIVILAECGGSSEADLTHEGDGVLTVWSFFEGAPKDAIDYYAEQTGNEVDF